MAAFESSVSDILESLHHCLDWHIVLQVLGFRASHGLQVLRRESPTQGQKQLWGPKTRLIFVDQKEFGWFPVGAGLCREQHHGHRQSMWSRWELPAQLRIFPLIKSLWTRCAVSQRTREIREKSFSFMFFPIPWTNTAKQSPNCGFSITASSPARFLNWKPSTNPIAFQIGLLRTAIKKYQMPHCQSTWPLHNCELHSYINVTNAIISISSCHRSGSESVICFWSKLTFGKAKKDKSKKIHFDQDLFCIILITRLHLCLWTLTVVSDLHLTVPRNS